MTKPHPQIDRAASSEKPHNRNVSSSFSCYSPKLSLLILAICVTLFVIFQIRFLHISQFPSSSYPSPASWPFIYQQWQKLKNNCTQDLDPITEKLRISVTFLPLKDLRYSDKALVGHTWFMSSLYDSHQEGEVQYQQFPSKSSQNRLLCIKGRDNHDGSWNYYALAWPKALPYNATLMKGLTFVSYNHYSYENIWHGLSAMVPFVAWHQKNNCELPTWWILYHWGELRLGMGPWLQTLMHATFDGEPVIERFDGIKDEDGGDPVCFEKAVVMRHNEGGMSRERRMEVYDLMRCKARMYCNVSLDNKDDNHKAVGMTLLMRTGPRSFKNESAIIGIFEKECAKIDGCRITVAYSNNLTFCEQVSAFFYLINLFLFNYINMLQSIDLQSYYSTRNLSIEAIEVRNKLQKDK